jgi:large exoprotein involved in heme utilization and adhesion
MSHPRAFGFLGAKAAGIGVDQSRLRVPDGQVLSIIGGDLRITGRASGQAVLQAPGGRINLVSVGSVATPGVVGEVVLPGPGQPAGVAVTGFARLGRIEITQSQTADTPTIDASGDAGGTVIARGAYLVVDRARIFADTFGDADGAPVGVDLGATDELVIRRGAQVGTFAGAGGRGGEVRLAAESVQISGAVADTLTFGTGAAGDVTVAGGAVELADGARVGSTSGSDGAAGNVTVTGTQAIRVLGRDSAGNGSAVAVTTETGGDGGRIAVSAPLIALDDGGTLQALAFGSGRGADIEVTAGQLDATRGGLIESVAVGRGDGGRVTVITTGAVTFTGTGPDDRPSGIFTSGRGDSRAGSVALDVGRLTLDDGALLQSGSEIAAQGGDVSITARESVVISGGSSLASQAARSDVRRVEIVTPFLLLDNGTIRASTIGSARAGDVILTVDRLELTRGGQVVSSAELQATGRGGDIVVAAADAVSISGRNAAGEASGLFSTASSTPRPGAPAGDAGRITVDARTLTMADGGTISVATRNAGRAGDIVLDVGTLTLSGGARIDSSTAAGGQGGTVTITADESVTITGTGNGMFSNAAGAGAAGQVTIITPFLLIQQGGAVSATTGGQGKAGDILLKVGTLALQSDAAVSSSTSGAGQGGTVTVSATDAIQLVGGQVTSNATGAGAGGNITLSGQLVSLADGAQISATSTGTGNAGNIVMTAGTALVSHSSTVTTGATTADGGDIVLSVGTLLYLVDSQVSATVGTGAGGGGNISIDPVFVVLQGSEVRADAFGGPGGNIDIVAGTFLADDSVLSASSALGVAGSVDVSAGVTDVSGATAPLPAALLQAAALLSESCVSRATAGRNSTLVVRTRDGVPPEPAGGILANPAVAGAGEPGPAPAGPVRGGRSPARLALVKVRCAGP